MKSLLILLALSVSVLAGPIFLRAYDNGPGITKVVPECIWAAASGGGTWRTEVQITNMLDVNSQISCTFFYGNGNRRGPFLLPGTPPLHHSLNFSNILETMDALDSGAFTYYGRVGALMFFGESTYILVTAKTVNGNYGKTFPGLSISEGNTAIVGRPMVIQGLVNNSTDRTFAGFFNPNTYTQTVRFWVISSDNTLVGSRFTKAFIAYDFMAFNPFVEAGAGTGSYSNCWLLIEVLSGSSTGSGLMGFGAIANKTTNDPAALLAYQYNW